MEQGSKPYAAGLDPEKSGTPESLEESMIDLEIALAKAFGWSLHELDETAIESLMPFISRISGENKHTAYCDEVGWL